MPKTRAELIDQALINLGIMQPGQTTTTENIAKMDTIVDGAVAELNDLDIYYVQDAGNIGPTGGEIEDSAFLSLADYIANRAASGFNLPADAKLTVLAQQAEAKLQIIGAPKKSLRVLRLDPAVQQPRRYRLFNFTNGT